MTEGKLVETSCIHLNSDAATFEEVIRLIGKSFMDKGIVKESYIEAVIEREKTFPTGLRTDGGNIAIPHTDSNHVNRSSVGVVVTKNPISVSMMGSLEVELACQLFFPLAMEHPKKQLVLLRELMGFFQDGKKISTIREAVTIAEVERVMSSLTLPKQV